MPAHDSDRSARFGAWSSAGKVLAMFLLILGGKFWVLQTCSSGLPVFDQWQAEGQHLLQPWLHGELRPGDLFAPWVQHRIVWTRLLVLGLFQINGQWDTQVEAIAATCVHASAAAWLGVVLIRRLGRASEDAVLLCLVLLFALPFAQEDTLSGGFASQYYTLLLLAVVAIWGLASHRAGSPGWWIGVAGAILAWFSVAAGAFPPLAVATWTGLRLARREGVPRDHWVTLGVALALGAGGLSLSIGVPPLTALEPRSTVELFTRFAGLLGWPNPTAWAAPVAYAPFACFIWRTLRSRQSADRTEALLGPLGFFVLLLTAALAYARNHQVNLGVSRYMDFLSFGALVNFACLLLFLKIARERGDPFPKRARLGLLTVSWVAVTGFGLCRLTTINLADDLPFVKSCNVREVENVFAFVTKHDLPTLLRQDPFAIQCDNQRLVADLLSDPRIRQVLPWQARPPVVLEAAAESPQVHRVENPDDPSKVGWVLEPRHDGRPVRFRSQVISGLRLPYLRFPETSSNLGEDSIMALVDERSGETTLLEPDASRGEWQSVVVKTPAGPFRVEAVIKAGSNRMLAFSYPREVGWLSAWVDTLLNSAVTFFFAGLGIWLGSVYWQRWLDSTVQVKSLSD